MYKKAKESVDLRGYFQDELNKNVFGSQATVFVTKEEYKQFEIGDKYRR